MTEPCKGSIALPCRFSRAICRIATGKLLVASFVLWIAVASLINGRPFGIAELKDVTGGATILDMTFTTSPQQVYGVLDALGEAGRAFDLTHIVPLDLVFPFVYALFLSVAISWVMNRWPGKESPWQRLNLLPVLAGTADYCENLGVITLLLSYPARIDPVATFTSSMYVVKFIFSALSYMVLFTALAGWSLAVIKARRARIPM